MLAVFSWRFGERCAVGACGSVWERMELRRRRRGRGVLFESGLMRERSESVGREEEAKCCGREDECKRRFKERAREKAV